MGQDIYYIGGWDEDKQYGKVLNRHIEHLPDDSYICVTDGDVMFLNHDYGRILKESIQDHPECELFTCSTNRSWGQSLDPDPNILNHYERSLKRPKKYTTMTGVVPAHLWMFPKSTWLKNKFDEHPIIHGFNSFDTRWTRRIHGIKIRIEHLYVFHFYRLNKKSKDYSHLI